MKKAIHIIKNRSDIGAGTRGSDLGIDAMEVAAINKGNHFFKEHPHIDVPTRNEVIYENDVFPFAKHIKEIYQQCKQVASTVEDSILQNHFPIVFSGDHSSAIGTISGIKSAFPDRTLGVFWIDAHTDIHSPYTTPSGNMHGMSLAAVLNEDHEKGRINSIDDETLRYWNKLKNIGTSDKKLIPAHLIYFGVRDVELPEVSYMAVQSIKNYTVDEVRQRTVADCVHQALEKLKKCDMLYVSFDVDSMDSELISNGTGTPVPRGFTQSEVTEILQGILHSNKVVCLEIAEVNPLLDKKGNKMAEVAFEILEDLIPLLN